MRVFKKKLVLRNQPWKKNKKRRRRERSRDDNRSQPNHIPIDLTVEILSRLPAKSVMRYQCVSKLWSSITRLPSFINSFTTRSSARLLLTFEFHKKQLVFSFPQNKNTDGSYSPVYSYHMENSNHDRYLQWESVQGLILLRGLRIWNPSLRRVLTLTRPIEHIPTSFDIRKSYLGYDPLEGKHKVLSLYYGSNFVKPLILTLGAQESWRTVTKGIPIHSPTHVRGLRGCFNGVLYFQARVDDQHIIMSFDVKSESFMNPIEYPECSPFRWLHNMIPYEGSLALFAHDFPFGTGELYILKDADGHKWTRQCLPGVSFKSEWRNLMHFKGITDAGELVFAPGSFVDSFYILYFDPRRNSFREAFFKGFMDDEFRRSDDGVPNNHGTCINVFPNHMESLVSL